MVARARNDTRQPWGSHRRVLTTIEIYHLTLIETAQHPPLPQALPVLLRIHPVRLAAMRDGCSPGWISRSRRMATTGVCLVTMAYWENRPTGANRLYHCALHDGGSCSERAHQSQKRHGFYLHTKQYHKWRRGVDMEGKENTAISLDHADVP